MGQYTATIPANYVVCSGSLYHSYIFVRSTFVSSKWDFLLWWGLHFSFFDLEMLRARIDCIRPDYRINRPTADSFAQ